MLMPGQDCGKYKVSWNILWYNKIREHKVKGACQDTGQDEGAPSGQVWDNLSNKINSNRNGLRHRITEMSMNPL